MKNYIKTIILGVATLAISGCEKGIVRSMTSDNDGNTKDQNSILYTKKLESLVMEIKDEYAKKTPSQERINLNFFNKYLYEGAFASIETCLSLHKNNSTFFKYAGYLISDLVYSLFKKSSSRSVEIMNKLHKLFKEDEITKFLNQAEYDRKWFTSDGKEVEKEVSIEINFFLLQKMGIKLVENSQDEDFDFLDLYLEPCCTYVGSRHVLTFWADIMLLIKFPKLYSFINRMSIPWYYKTFYGLFEKNAEGRYNITNLDVYAFGQWLDANPLDDNLNESLQRIPVKYMQKCVESIEDKNLKAVRAYFKEQALCDILYFGEFLAIEGLDEEDDDKNLQKFCTWFSNCSNKGDKPHRLRVWYSLYNISASAKDEEAIEILENNFDIAKLILEGLQEKKNKDKEIDEMMKETVDTCYSDLDLDGYNELLKTLGLIINQKKDLLTNKNEKPAQKYIVVAGDNDGSNARWILISLLCGKLKLEGIETEEEKEKLVEKFIILFKYESSIKKYTSMCNSSKEYDNRDIKEQVNTLLEVLPYLRKNASNEITLVCMGDFLFDRHSYNPIISHALLNMTCGMQERFVSLSAQLKEKITRDENNECYMIEGNHDILTKNYILGCMNEKKFGFRIQYGLNAISKDDAINVSNTKINELFYPAYYREFNIGGKEKSILFTHAPLTVAANDSAYYGDKCIKNAEPLIRNHMINSPEKICRAISEGGSLKERMEIDSFINIRYKNDCTLYLRPNTITINGHSSNEGKSIYGIFRPSGVLVNLDTQSECWGKNIGLNSKGIQATFMILRYCGHEKI